MIPGKKEKTFEIGPIELTQRKFRNIEDILFPGVGTQDFVRIHLFGLLFPISFWRNNLEASADAEKIPLVLTSSVKTPAYDEIYFQKKLN